MKKLSKLLIAAFICGAMAITAGCGKKEVAYSGSSNSNMPEGKDFPYPSSEGAVTGEEFGGGRNDNTLDATSQGSGDRSTDFSMAADQQSDEYKRLHGRSSPEMQPIYFDFDQASVRMDQGSRMEHNAEYLRSNPNASVVVEGNCDERGTNEYNMGLGERRAQSAKNYLMELGIEEHRIRTRTLGEDRPLFLGQDEDSWAQNRRDDFILE